MLVLFLPPYSPEYNPIEMFWNVVKAYLKNRGGKAPRNDGDNKYLWEAIIHADTTMNMFATAEHFGYAMDANFNFDLEFKVRS